MTHHLAKVRIALPEGPVAGEIVWAEPLGDGRFRLCGIPFYAQGYAEGDIVRCVRVDGADEVVAVESASGNGMIRLLFVDAESAAARQILSELSSVQCTFEVASAQLIAVTIPPTLEVPFSQLANYLNAQPDSVLLGWEIGKRLQRAS